MIAPIREPDVKRTKSRSHLRAARRTLLSAFLTKDNETTGASRRAVSRRAILIAGVVLLLTAVCLADLLGLL